MMRANNNYEARKLCVNLSKLCLEYSGLFLSPDTVYINLLFYQHIRILTKNDKVHDVLDVFSKFCKACSCLLSNHCCSYTASSHRTFKHRKYSRNISHKNIRQWFIFSVSVCFASRSSYLLSFHWHIRIKSTAYILSHHQCCESYILNVTCYSYTLHFSASNFLQLQYSLKVSSYFWITFNNGWNTTPEM